MNSIEAKVINIEEGKLLLEKKPTQDFLWQEFLQGFDNIVQEAKGDIPTIKAILLTKYKIRKL